MVLLMFPSDQGGRWPSFRILFLHRTPCLIGSCSLQTFFIRRCNQRVSWGQRQQAGATMWRSTALLLTERLASFLRETIKCVPTGGIPLDDVELKVKDRFRVSPDGDQKESPSNWRKVLNELNDAHYISGTTLYPCNWEAVIQSIAAEIPREGIVEKGLVSRILKFEPRFSCGVDSLGEPLGMWIQRRFSHLIAVSRSASTGEPIYRPAEEKLPEEVEGIINALRLLGREKLPVFTDFALITPLLPAGMSPPKGSWVSFLEQDSVRQHFDVDVDVHIRLSPKRTPSIVFVDGTSIKLPSIGETLAAKGLADSIYSVRVFRRHEDPLWSSDDVVLQSFLDPEHAIGAAIASLGARGSVKIYVLCGEEVKERYKLGLMDLLGSAEKDIMILTPCNECATLRSDESGGRCVERV
uniref:Uncharacterized protein n=1 Tax=Trypanosoma congolense (strain IL3000) TaxID=1068625 RepID=G0UVH3_TRYCI|nr:conserved hypothetical protein [Trypanosoma congolense IL3000]